MQKQSEVVGANTWHASRATNTSMIEHSQIGKQGWGHQKKHSCECSSHVARVARKPTHGLAGWRQTATTPMTTRCPQRLEGRVAELPALPCPPAGCPQHWRL